MYNITIYYAQIMPKTKITKQKLIQLINYVDFLSENEKNEWKLFIENANNSLIKKTYEYFKDIIQKENDKKIVIMAKHNLTDKFQKKFKSYSKKFISKIKNNESI